MIFTRFTREARRCVADSLEQARLLGHDFVGDEDILLSILQNRDTLASRVLADAGVDAEVVRRESKNMLSDSLARIGISFEDIRKEVGDSFDMELPEGRKITFSPAAKAALERSMKEAVELGGNSIRAEHILLGVLSSEDGMAARLIGRLGVSPESVRERLLSTMTE